MGYLSIRTVGFTVSTIYPNAVVYIFDFMQFEEDDELLERLPVEFEDVSMVVQENNIFSLIDDQKWAQTMPARRGFVRLGSKGRSFSLAAYHQLHCINSLRFSYTVARDGLVTDPEVLKDKIGHDNHCFQFIRQSILCKADDALVPFGQDNRTLSGAGFGISHKCRNWAQLRNFVLENDKKWDGIPFLEEGIKFEGDES